MYLKNLTVFGFKSFADRTTFAFQPGITAVVGPNGCGKSNVADAIRWVLGEQSAKALRGGEMADVIFNGTDQRKPLSMAEVSLTLGNVDAEHLKAAGVEVAFNEVTLTRRVFRDGGSEYFLNKVPCRLRDIQQLFMGTGVGRTSYSIMAQGNITQILSSRPDDRRIVFEEAAGITKFKSQKKEALRKLEYTEQNLLRVSDLIREVKRQIGSLQRQAGKARRFKQLSAELQHLDTQLARHQYDLLVSELMRRRAELEEMRTEIERYLGLVQDGETKIAGLRQRVSDLDAEIGAAQQNALGLRNEADKHESRIHFNEQRIQELKTQHGAALEEISQSEARRVAAEMEKAALAEQLAACQATLGVQQSTLNERRNALREIEAAQQTGQESLRRCQAETFSNAQALSRVRNEINSLDLQKQGHSVRLEKLQAEKVQLEEEKRRLEAHLQEFQANVEAERLDVQTRRGTVEERQTRLRELLRELAETTQELDRWLRQQAEVRSRLDVLQQLQEAHEGFSAGTLAALQRSQSVLGSLADRIRVPAEYVVAIETALGHHLQLVLTEQPETACQILQELSAQKRGRASIAALSMGPGAAASPALASPEAAAPAPAADLGLPALSVIETDDALRPLLQCLLGQTHIVADLQGAMAAWTANGRCHDFVTRSGEILTRHGIFTGGSSNGAGKNAASILGRKNQIESLQSELTQLQERIGEISRRKGALASEQTALQATLQEAQAALRAQEVAVATRQGEFTALTNSNRVLGQKIETVLYEIKSLSAQEEEGRHRRQQLAVQLEALENKDRSLQQQLAELNAALEESRLRRDVAQAALTEIKVAVAAEEQRLAAFRQQQQPLDARIRELQATVDQRRGEVSAFLQRCTQAELEIEESRRRIAALAVQRESLNAQVAELQGQRSGHEEDLVFQEDDLRTRRRRLTELQEGRGTVEVEIAQKEMSAQNLKERIQQKYQVDLDTIRSECITITIADEGPAKVETLSPEDMAARGLATDWEAVAGQVTALQRRLDEMGPVNLVAIEEYEETEQRYQFLSGQHDDLVKAKDQLQELISRINAQTQTMFSETFAKIRENFRSMFTEIFGGGKADLLLVNEGDVLESGIEIVARPPGKQLQSISLLSGGEQTMTAVSLLFAIYQVRPSPFCLLDELDAPLDESNINRFIRVLQRFLAHSQFVIITHNKRTIGMADVLYGITMEERGVSRLVSVKFHKADEQGDQQTMAPLEPPASVPPVEAEEDAPHKRAETFDVVLAK